MGQHHPLRLSVWLYRQNAHDILLGICETTIQNLLYACIEDSVSEGCPADKTLFVRKPPSRTLKDFRKEVESGKLGVKIAQIVSPGDVNVHEDVSVFNGSGDSVVFDSILASPPRSSSSSRIAASMTPIPSFADYLSDGCVLDFCAALDFTSSNGASSVSSIELSP